MPIKDVIQPNIIQIDDGLRLRKLDENIDIALEWYQDTETVWYIDGDKALYSKELLEKMYRYWDSVSEVYFIEVYTNGTYQPIGDVSFYQEDMPIVIGNKSYRGKGIGKKVIQTLIERGKSLGYDRLYIEEIYDFNVISQNLYMSLGFKKKSFVKKGWSYELVLSS
ncbi:GNAT family N-acetyltransferase [Carnobacteriaceae bacterium zg-ZUI252]|nr:GNAT family N-acetyltransferase [Carnobacteriaceae bacterium zg-ZUI252]